MRGAGRLRLTGYLGAVVLVFVLGGLLAALYVVESVPTGEVRAMSRHVAARLIEHRADPAQLQADLDELAATRVAFTVYDADRRLLGSSVAPPLSPRLIDRPDERGRLTFIHEVREDGRLLGTVVVDGRPPRVRTLLIGLLVLLVMLGLLVLVIVRHVGAPLQRIATAARRFGDGDLSARAGLTRKDELGEVGRTFDQMAERVTLLMNTQRELMANVSHELRTPLARVQVAVDLMLDGVDDRAKELLPEISGDLAEVERLIEDVMTLARFDLAQAEGAAAGAPLRREVTALAPLVTRAAARFRVLHPERELAVVGLDALPTLSVDPVLVLRVLDNLLENASKYSERGTAIELRAAADGAGASVTVTDHGIGIDPDDLPRVFTPFFRTDRSRSRATGGAGLGLGLARRVVLAHGGTIGIRSEPNLGTSVTFTLPARPSTEQDAP